MIILIKYEAPKKIEQGRGKMKKIISNLSVVIFVIGCAIMEIKMCIRDRHGALWCLQGYRYHSVDFGDFMDTSA